LTIKGDSQLIIKQFKGEYKIKSKNLQELYHIDRKLNSEADKLANLSLDNPIQEITN